MTWVKENGNWVTRTQHYSAAVMEESIFHKRAISKINFIC